MPLQRNEFIPQSITTVYSSPSGLTDIRTGAPYQMGGLYPGTYFDLTEAEAQALSSNLHTGRYRFVQIDSAATAANIKQGTIGLMKSLAGGVNLITSYDQGLNGGIRPVVFLGTVTSAQVSAGAYVFVQEAGDASVLMKSSLTNGAPAAGDLVVSAATGVVDDPTQSTNLTYALEKLIIGTAEAAPTANTLCRVMLNLPVIQG